MRISGGSLRGRTVACPPGVIRPAMDRMRESLFSILGPLEEVSFLDLFSGSGLVGLEAWSRGARPVMLVEKDRGKRATIRTNCDGLSPAPQLRIEPVERFVARNRSTFDIVYLDPPFDYPYKQDLLQRIGRSGSIHPGSRVIIHAPRGEAFDETAAQLTCQDVRQYGGSVLTFFTAPAAQ